MEDFFLLRSIVKSLINRHILKRICNFGLSADPVQSSNVVKGLV